MEYLVISDGPRPLENVWISTSGNSECADIDFEDIDLFSKEGEILVKTEDGKLAAYMEYYLFKYNEEAFIRADDHMTEAGEAIDILIRRFGKPKDFQEFTYLAYIHTLYVLPEYRKQGIAAVLLNRFSELMMIRHDANIYAMAILPEITEVTIEKDHITTLYKEDVTDKDKKDFEYHKSYLVKNGFRKARNERYYYKKVL